MTTLKSIDREIEVQPLEEGSWPDGYERREPSERRPSRFKAGLSSTLELLERELRPDNCRWATYSQSSRNRRRAGWRDRERDELGRFA